MSSSQAHAMLLLLVKEQVKRGVDSEPQASSEAAAALSEL